jgi:hypothetical protein
MARCIGVVGAVVVHVRDPGLLLLTAVVVVAKVAVAATAFGICRQQMESLQAADSRCDIYNIALSIRLPCGLLLPQAGGACFPTPRSASRAAPRPASGNHPTVRRSGR